MKDLVALDCFTAPTVTCRVLFVLVILAHDRRRIAGAPGSTAWTLLHALGEQISMVQFQRRVGFKIVFEARREQGNSHRGMLLLSSAAQVEGGCVSTVVTLVAEVWYDSMCQERIGVDQG